MVEPRSGQKPAHGKSGELKRRRPKPRIEKWWEKAPTLPGEACTPVQRRLADEKEHYTGVCRLLQADRCGQVVDEYCSGSFDSRAMTIKSALRTETT
eukprot:Skav218016  [mRNA]  locus=scaffold2344:217447:220456:- [translate_table: standard]